MRTADMKDVDITHPLFVVYSTVSVCLSDSCPVVASFRVTFYTLSQSGNPRCGFNTSFGSMLRYSLVPPTIHSETGWFPLLYSLGTIRVLGLSMGHASHTVANPDSLVPYGP